MANNKYGNFELLLDGVDFSNIFNIGSSFYTYLVCYKDVDYFSFHQLYQLDDLFNEDEDFIEKFLCYQYLESWLPMVEYLKEE